MTDLAVPPAPSADALASAPVHVVVRDWPETLVPLRRAGVDPKADGARALGLLPDAARLVDVCLEACTWRGRTG